MQLYPEDYPVKARVSVPGAYVEIQVSPSSGIDLNELLELVEGAIYGVGFKLNGSLTIEEEEINNQNKDLNNDLEDNSSNNQKRKKRIYHDNLNDN